MRTPVYLAFVAVVASVCPAGRSSAQPGGCTIVLPAPMRGQPGRWLGGCMAGKATGVGVLRAGAHAPYFFFFGRVVAGTPQSGLLLYPNRQYTEVRGLGADGAVVSAGDDFAAQNRAWADAAAGTRLVARRFAAAGNRNSAAYYNHEAYRIENERPD